MSSALTAIDPSALATTLNVRFAVRLPPPVSPAPAVNITVSRATFDAAIPESAPSFPEVSANSTRLPVTAPAGPSKSPILGRLPICMRFLLLVSALSSMINKSATTGVTFSTIAEISEATLSWIAEPSAPSLTVGLGYVPLSSPPAAPTGEPLGRLLSCNFFLLLESALSSIINKSAATGVTFSAIEKISLATLSWTAVPSAPSLTLGLGYVPLRSPPAEPDGGREALESSSVASVTAAFNSVKMPAPRLPISVAWGLVVLAIWASSVAPSADTSRLSTVPTFVMF